MKFQPSWAPGVVPALDHSGSKLGDYALRAIQPRSRRERATCSPVAPQLRLDMANTGRREDFPPYMETENLGEQRGQEQRGQTLYPLSFPARPILTPRANSL
jgi:hypothetical protein